MLWEEHPPLQHDKKRLLAKYSETQTCLAQAQNAKESLRGERNVLRQMIQVVDEDRRALQRDLETARKALVDASRKPMDSST